MQMYSNDKLYMHSLQGYLVFISRIANKAIWEINTKRTLSSGHEQFATPTHTLSSISYMLARENSGNLTW